MCPELKGAPMRHVTVICQSGPAAAPKEPQRASSTGAGADETTAICLLGGGGRQAPPGWPPARAKPCWARVDANKALNSQAAGRAPGSQGSRLQLPTARAQLEEDRRLPPENPHLPQLLLAAAHPLPAGRGPAVPLARQKAGAHVRRARGSAVGVSGSHQAGVREACLLPTPPPGPPARSAPPREHSKSIFNSQGAGRRGIGTTLV